MPSLEGGALLGPCKILGPIGAGGMGSSLRMSVVNLAETLILVEDRQPQLFEEIRDSILASPVRFVPPTVEHARAAAEARSRLPLNLGDCFAYAPALDEDCPILTLDRHFRRTDLTLIQPR
jgi:uncharacterized protein with PIN domain